MLLTLLAYPHPSGAPLAVDEVGTVWLELRAGIWGRGRIDAGAGRPVYLRPMYLASWPPLTLEALQAAV